MSFTFDLISDLYVDTWPETDWSSVPTSTVAVVAGNVSVDRKRTAETLKKLGRAYQAVFYIDGCEEHRQYLSNLGYSYTDLVARINRIENVVYLQDNVVVIDNVAILGTNGWWGFDFDLSVDPTASCLEYQEKLDLSTDAVKAIAKMSTNDAIYMINSVKRLQKHRDVKKIVMVTHTVPDPVLISHDMTLEDTLEFNIMGNRIMRQVLDYDVEHKIHTWCFGRYHGAVDQYRDGIRWVNNCRGPLGSPWGRHVYHPLRITVDY